MNKGPFWIRRVGRTLLWRNPALYRLFGRLRGRGDCMSQDYDIWIDGYPRSASNFAVSAFKLANPTVRIRSQQHIPSFIIHSIDSKKPGMLLIRKPEDAIISWSIFWNADLSDCLDYYLDFHLALETRAQKMFLIPFEAVTHEFGRVIERFNEHFGTRYNTVQHDASLVADCFSRIEQPYLGSGQGIIDERRVCRPSEVRAGLKGELAARLRTSPLLSRKLEKAEELYQFFYDGTDWTPAASTERREVLVPAGKAAEPVATNA